MSKKTKKPISQRICQSLDIPMGTLGRTSFIEGVGNRELSISGCVSLISYEEDRVALRLCDGDLTISGRELELRSFLNGDIAVCGIITNIRYGSEDDNVS